MPIRRRALAALAVAAALPAFARPAMARGVEEAPPFVVLRPLVVVDDPVLRLGDLFEGVDGATAARPVAAAPPPGRRVLLETGPLMALARAHGLAWRPLSTEERAVVERPGRALAREEVETALHDALVERGLDPDSLLDLGTLPGVMVPPGAPPELAVESPVLDAAAGRFSATLVIAAEGMATLRQRIAGRAMATVPAVLATRRLALGTIVRPEDMRVARLRAQRARPGLAADPAQVVGLELRRPIAAGMPFMAADLGAPILVQRRSLVIMVVDVPGLQLSAKGQALASAPLGALVPVMNLTSRTVVEAEVIGPGRVRVGPAGAARNLAGLR